ncbi:MAG: hypothetical protein E7057_00985 [Lentisphaerae bacterium]|nr:hypothetical protein [Lentisphaerota bacterium]
MSIVNFLPFNKVVLVILAVSCMMVAVPPKARAIDPITLAILAPVAIRVAEAAKPYVLRSLVGTGKGLFNVGKASLELLYLPYGIGEVTIGLPFRKGKRGLVHIIRGGVIAPTKMVLNLLLLPVYMTGAKINI